MTFWDFADKHWFVTGAFAFATLIVMLVDAHLVNLFTWLESRKRG